jgi:hypothetical protein
MRIGQTCSWCHELVDTTGGPTTCPNCGHRADAARLDCDCPACRRAADDADGNDEPLAALLRWWCAG